MESKATCGRIVQYMAAEGEVRPLLIVKSWDGEKVNGVLFTDGANDASLFPDAVSACTKWVTSVPYSDQPQIGHWSWPVKN
jgi:hypothetical protein